MFVRICRFNTEPNRSSFDISKLNNIFMCLGNKAKQIALKDLTTINRRRDARYRFVYDSFYIGNGELFRVTENRTCHFAATSETSVERNNSCFLPDSLLPPLSLSLYRSISLSPSEGRGRSWRTTRRVDRRVWGISWRKITLSPRRRSCRDIPGRRRAG